MFDKPTTYLSTSPGHEINKSYAVIPTLGIYNNPSNAKLFQNILYQYPRVFPKKKRPSIKP